METTKTTLQEIQRNRLLEKVFKALQFKGDSTVYLKNLLFKTFNRVVVYKNQRKDSQSAKQSALSAYYEKLLSKCFQAWVKNWKLKLRNSRRKKKSFEFFREVVSRKFYNTWVTRYFGKTKQKAKVRRIQELIQSNKKLKVVALLESHSKYSKTKSESLTFHTQKLKSKVIRSLKNHKSKLQEKRTKEESATLQYFHNKKMLGFRLLTCLVSEKSLKLEKAEEMHNRYKIQLLLKSLQAFSIHKTLHLEDFNKRKQLEKTISKNLMNKALCLWRKKLQSLLGRAQTYQRVWAKNQNFLKKTVFRNWHANLKLKRQKLLEKQNLYNQAAQVYCLNLCKVSFKQLHQFHMSEYVKHLKIIKAFKFWNCKRLEMCFGGWKVRLVKWQRKNIDNLVSKLKQEEHQSLTQNQKVLELVKKIAFKWLSKVRNKTPQKPPLKLEKQNKTRKKRPPPRRLDHSNTYESVGSGTSGLSKYSSEECLQTVRHSSVQERINQIELELLKFNSERTKLKQFQSLLEKNPSNEFLNNEVNQLKEKLKQELPNIKSLHQEIQHLKANS